MPEIVKGIKSHFTDLFDRKSTKNNDQCTQFLQGLNISQLSAEHKEFLNKPLSIEELQNSIKNSQNGKSPGNDGLTRKFYIVFWKDISDLVFQSLVDGKEKGFLSPSQRQAIIKLLDKNKDK